MGSEILKIVNLGLVFNSLQYIQSTYFQAIGRRLVSVLLALCSQVICFIPVTAVMSRYFGLRGIWISFPVAAALALTISSALLLLSVRAYSAQ